MTPTQLTALLDSARQLLQNNKAFFTPERISKFSQALPLIGQGLVIISPEFQPVVDYAKGLLATEIQLSGGLEATITGAIDNLENHPLELDIVAALFPAEGQPVNP